MVTLWSLSDLMCTQTFAHVDYPLRSIAFSYDARVLAYASEAQLIAFSNVETGAMSKCSIVLTL